LINFDEFKRDGVAAREECRGSLELQGRLNIFLKIEKHQEWTFSRWLASVCPGYMPTSWQQFGKPKMSIT